jgi:hypothetical protein
MRKKQCNLILLLQCGCALFYTKQKNNSGKGRNFSIAAVISILFLPTATKKSISRQNMDNGLLGIVLEAG